MEEEIKIADLWELVNTKIQRQETERVELSTLRLNEEKIRKAMQKLTRLPKLSEAMEAIKQIREVLGL